MVLTDRQNLLAEPSMQALIAEIQNGLPLVDCPYAAIGERVGLSEMEVIESINLLMQLGVIKRLGIVVRHHELGFNANAMVVWNVPDSLISRVGRCFAAFPFVTLCYQRPRRLPVWPFNLFTMIHGKDRAHVIECMDELAVACGLTKIPHQAIFSTRRFKQRGARYADTCRSANTDQRPSCSGEST